MYRFRRLHLGPVVAISLYAALLGWVVDSIGGLPAARDLLVPLLVGGLLAASATSIRRVRRVAFALVVDWAPFTLSLWLYDLIRGYADGAWMPVHYQPEIEIDRAIGFGTVPTVWLQRHLWHGHTSLRWYDYASWATYMSYFFVPTLLLAVLWWRSRPAFRRLAAMVVALAFAGCATFVLFPAAPPWLAANRGAIPHVSRLIGEINPHVPLISFQPLWEKGTQYANNVAAVPSLHSAYTLLVALFLFRRMRSRWRFLLWLYPLAMAFALVYTGEHYVTDIVLGWLYAAAVYAAVEWAAARLPAFVSRRPAAVALPLRTPSGPR